MSQLELKKICIAQTQLDPHVLMNFVSPYTQNRATKILKNIKEKYTTNPSGMEYAVAQAIFEKFQEGPRTRRFAYILLMKALEGKMISNPTYIKIREALGVSEYSKDTEEFLTKKEEQKRPDVFEMVTDTSNKNQIQGESK